MGANRLLHWIIHSRSPCIIALIAVSLNFGAEYPGKRRTGGRFACSPLIRVILGVMPKKLELLTKQIAAERLGLSVRRVMELSADGTFARHRAFDPDTKREAVMFDAAEVAQFAAGLATVPAPADRALAVRPQRLPLDEYDIDDDGRGAGRLWLTLAEAAAYSGLPASHLLAAIEAGELAARDVGVRPGGHWRVRRLDLDAIEGELLA